MYFVVVCLNILLLVRCTASITDFHYELQWDKLTIMAGVQPADVVHNLTVVSPNNETITATQMTAASASRCTAYTSSSFHTFWKNDRRVDYVCNYGAVADGDMTYLVIRVDVPDDATVSGNWNMIIDKKVNEY
jgi:hypothetical protein